MCDLTSHLLMLSCHQLTQHARPGRFFWDPRWWKSRPGSTQEMVDLGNILKMKTLQRHFARPKSRPLIVFYQASSVPMVNQAVISLIRGCKAIGMCMNQQICILDCLYPKIHCSRRNKIQRFSDLSLDFWREKLFVAGAAPWSKRHFVWSVVHITVRSV